MLIAPVLDLRLRDAGDVLWLERQLDRIAARGPDHLPRWYEPAEGDVRMWTEKIMD